MIILNHINTNRINTMQNYAIWIQIVLSFILKLKMFMKIDNSDKKAKGKKMSNKKKT